MPASLPIPFGFSDPQFLWALLLVLPWAWWLQRHSRTGLGGKRLTWSKLLRWSLLLTLVLAVAGLRVEWRSNDLSVVFVVDRSDSVSSKETDRALALVNQALATKRTHDRAGVVVFASDALVEREPSSGIKNVDRLQSVVENTGFTDISKALRLAVGLFPEGTQRRIVLMTDGNENMGQAATEAALAAANGIPVDVVPLSPGNNDEVLVDSVVLPERIDKNRSFDVRITVVATKDGPATVRLFKNRAVVAQNEVQLTAGKNVFLIPQTETEPGYNTYEATVDASADSVRDNNVATAHGMVQGEPRVLLVGADEDTRALRDALVMQKIPTDVSPQAPLQLAEAENYDAIFLVNQSAEQYSDNQMKLLRSWCGELGGGLAMLGGPETFALGAWQNTPVEEALPVSMRLKDRKNFPSLGILILVDKSGSMSGTLPGGGQTKLEIAAEAAVKAVEQLRDEDYVGVIGFDSAAKWDAPWQLAKNKAAIAAQIRSLRPGGGTDVIPALNGAVEIFGSARVQLKHVILLTDGMVAPGDFDAISADLKRLNVTVTCVGVGDDADRAFLNSFANKNRGRAHFTNRASDVPRIFTKETVIAQRSYLVEGAFTPRPTASSQVLRGLGALPQLQGYVSTQEKDRAEVALRSQREDPILALWRYRSGKALAWTSDARDRWSINWVQWPGYKKFWEQAARWVLRDRKKSTLSPRVVVENGKGRIAVEAMAESGEFQNFLGLEATVLTPELDVKKVKLRQTAAGQYEGEFDAKGTGTYLATVGGNNVEPATAGANVSYPPEYRTTRPNGLLLSQIAAETDGRVNPTAAEFFRAANKRVESIRELWPAMLSLALLLFLADIAVRRVALDEEQRAQVRAFFARFIPGRQAAQAAEAVAGTLGALQKRRADVRQGLSSPSAPSAPAAPSNTVSPASPRVTTILPPRTNADGTSDEAPLPLVPAKPKTPTTPDNTQPPAPSDASPTTHTSRLLEARRRAKEKRDP